jgi:uncharacterized protein YbbC (DUF1343 family)
MTHVRTGLERLLDDDQAMVRGRRIGVVAHPASVTSTLRHAVDALRDVGADVCALFGPEHGLGGEAQDMEGVTDGDTTGRAGRVPTYSLYGATFESLSPRPAWLDGLDAVVVDLQDVGSRYYTFVWTALLVARACAAKGIEVIVCDRPNPLGGVITEGAPQRDDERSFVGLRCVPVRHALTVGELVRDAARAEGLSNVTVVAMEGWRRAMRWRDTGLPWVLPSPNMPTDETATVYPGGCLLEGTNLSEGRGTTRPFELLGAPWADPLALAKSVRAHASAGCHARVTTYRPMFQKHAGVTCRGVQVHVTDAAVFEPYRAYLALIAAARRMEGFRWRTEKYEFVDDRPAIDLLTGDGDVRRALDAGADFEEVMRVGDARMTAWRATERDRWLYTG